MTITRAKSRAHFAGVEITAIIAERRILTDRARACITTDIVVRFRELGDELNRVVELFSAIRAAEKN